MSVYSFLSLKKLSACSPEATQVGSTGIVSTYSFNKLFNDGPPIVSLYFPKNYIQKNWILSHESFSMNFTNLKNQKQQKSTLKTSNQSIKVFKDTKTINMINPLFLPQHYKRRKKTTIEQVTQINSVRRQFKVIHQLDCIYQGELNQSYQKQGFGIQQTNDFHTYIGYWKGGKTSGIGMIFYPEGGLIYGNFKDNQLFGNGLIDNKTKLTIGQFQNHHIVGIGFQYNYVETKWKLCRFHKGIVIETISQTTQSIENGIPSIMNLHEDMCLLLSRYLSRQYFDVSYKSFIETPYKSYTQMNVHKIGKNFLYFGQLVQGKYWGLGLIYDKKNACSLQIGYYEMGEFNGYGIKIDKEKNKIQIGLYRLGKKQGFFYEKTNNLETIVEYQKDYIKGQSSQMNRQKMKNLQKIYNYQKSDFYSEKNKIHFYRYKDLLNHDNKQLHKLNQTLKHNLSAGKSKQKQETTQKIHSDKKSIKYMAPQTSVHKSTVQIMRQKLKDIDNIIKRSKAIMKEQKQKKESKNQVSKSKGHLDRSQKKQSEQKKEETLQDASIQEEYEPVSKGILQENVSRRKYRGSYTPNSQMKIRSPSKSPINNTTGQKRVTIQLDQNQIIQPFTLYTDRSPNLQKSSRSASRRKKRRIFQ